VERFFFTWVTVIAALSAAAGPGVARADDERPVSKSLLPVSARADIAVRGESGGLAVLLLTDRVELGRGDSRMQADRAILWIGPDTLPPARQGVDGGLRRGERPHRGAGSPGDESARSSSAGRLETDGGRHDGLIPTQSGPFKGPFMERAEAARKAGVVPREPATVLPPKEKPPVAQFPPRETPGIAEVPPREPKPPSGKVPPKEVPPSGVVEPVRIGLIYGQQQEGPDIKTTVEGDYRVTVITRYPDIVFQDPTSERGQFEILAENMVIWVNESKLKEPGGLREADLQIYAEGTSSSTRSARPSSASSSSTTTRTAGSHGGRTRRPRPRPGHHRGPHHALLLPRQGVPPGLGRPVHLAKRHHVHQRVSTRPSGGIVCSEVALTAGTRTVTDESGRTREVQAMERADAWDTKLEVEGVPLFYWPYFSHDLQNNRTILRKAHLVSSNQ